MDPIDQILSGFDGLRLAHFIPVAIVGAIVVIVQVLYRRGGLKARRRDRRVGRARRRAQRELSAEDRARLRKSLGDPDL